MTLALQIAGALALAYLAVELALYWLPLLALITRRPRRAVPGGATGGPAPFFMILAACRDDAVCLSGFVKGIREHEYPAGRFRLWIVADHCVDESASVARALGVSVYERPAGPAGKGNSLNDVLAHGLMSEPFDALVILDVDDRLKPDFLKRAANYAAPLARVISCATYAKHPDRTLYTHIGGIIQALLRAHQSGRAALGLDAILYGSHGYILSREALTRLGWHTTTGQVAEDMELRLRCRLHDIPVYYAPDLAVYNDVTGDAREVREQRRRWNSTYLPLIPRYLWPLLRKTFAGDWRALEDLFGLLLLPSFANLFLYLTGFLLASLAIWPLGFFRAHAVLAAILWAMDVAYFVVAFHALRIAIGGRELKGFLAHLGLRTVALFEGLIFIHVKDWRSAPHRGDG